MDICLSNTSIQVRYSRRNSYELVLEHKTIALRFCQLLALRAKVLELTEIGALEELINGDNFVLLFVADKQHVLYLDVGQLLAVKEALAYTFQDTTYSY